MNSRIATGLRALPLKRLASTSAAPALSNELNWAQYLKLRKSKRTVGILTSIPTTLVGLSSGVNYFASIEAEPTALILGLEPVYAYGIATVACIGAGYLAGPILGNQIWQLFNRRILTSMEAKDKGAYLILRTCTPAHARCTDFYAHIKRNRVDPSRQSVSNVSPSYHPVVPVAHVYAHPAGARLLLRKGRNALAISSMVSLLFLSLPRRHAHHVVFAGSGIRQHIAESLASGRGRMKSCKRRFEIATKSVLRLIPFCNLLGRLSESVSCCYCAHRARVSDTHKVATEKANRGCFPRE